MTTPEQPGGYEQSPNLTFDTIVASLRDQRQELTDELRNAYEQEHAAIERRRRARAQLREVERLLRAVGDIPRKPRTKKAAE